MGQYLVNHGKTTLRFNDKNEAVTCAQSISRKECRAVMVMERIFVEKRQRFVIVPGEVVDSRIK